MNEYDSIPIVLDPTKTLDLFQKISQSIIAVFANSSDDFFVLHEVTATHAFRFLIPFLEGERALLQCIRYLWRALLTGYIVQNRIQVLPYEQLKEKEDKDDWDWNKIKSLAIQSDDVHIIKFVYSCLSEYEISNNIIYKIMAQRYVKNLNATH